MADSDDYFSDPALDDTLLALLDRAESKYYHNHSPPNSNSTSAGPPPPKRQKTNHDRPGRVSPEDIDYMPVVSIRRDGGYALSGSQGFGGVVRGVTQAEASNVNGTSATRAPASRGTSSQATQTQSRRGSTTAVANHHRTSSNSNSVSQNPQSRTHSLPRTQSQSQSQSKPPSATQSHILKSISEWNKQQQQASTTRTPARNVSYASIPPVSQTPTQTQTQTQVQVQVQGRPPSSKRQSSASSSSFVQLNREPTQSLDHREDAAAAEALRKELDEMRAQLEELRQGELRAQKAIEDAHHARLAKEGEVSNLRRNMTKTAEQHLAEIAKLKAAKDQAEAAQAQIQKETREEMERLRTQFTFKQHELETSHRPSSSQLPSSSSRATRYLNKDSVSFSPMGFPSQLRSAWNDSMAGPSSSAAPIQSTPLRPAPKKVLTNANVQPTTTTTTTPKKSALPGFHNSFLPSSPTESRRGGRSATPTKPQAQGQAQDKGKGKGKAKEMAPPPLPVPPAFGFGFGFGAGGGGYEFNVDEDPPIPSPPSSPTPTPRASRQRQRQVRAETVPVPMEVDVDDKDSPFVPAVNAMNLDEASSPTKASSPINAPVPPILQISPEPEDIELLEGPTWSAELHRLVFTHVSPASPSLTVRLLLSTHLPAAQVREYMSTWERVLHALGAPDERDECGVIVELSSAFVKVARILNSADLVIPLTALMNLLTVLCFSFPLFASALLSPFLDDQEQAVLPPILDLLSKVVLEKLSQKSQLASTTEFTSLAKETFGLLDMLCCNVSDELEERLASIPRIPGMLTTLLDGAQPTWFLSRSTQLLAFMSSRHRLFRPLLSFPVSTPPEEAKMGRIPHVERLCSLLVDDHHRGPDAESMRICILTFFSMLSISHSDAITILLESQTLIPALITFLTHLVTALWDTSDQWTNSPDLIPSSIRTMSQTLFLLHRLVFGITPVFPLRLKLHHAHERQFNGLIHLFIVTLGRLSYADPPEWVEGKGRSDLDGLAEMARDLLELLAEGPEADSIWEAYQGQDDHSDTDRQIRIRRHDQRPWERFPVLVRREQNYFTSNRIDDPPVCQ